MPDPIKVMIGGEEIALPPIMNFETLERAWPAIEAFSAARDGIVETSACLAMFAAVLVETKPDLTLPALKKRLRINRADGSDERPGISAAAARLLVASGLVQKESSAGEELPAAPPPAPSAPADPISSTSSPS